MLLYLILILFVLLGLGLGLLWLARRVRQQTGLPVGSVVYQDTGGWEKVEKPLISRRYGLVGKPDYLVQVQEKGRSWLIPVEVKSRKRPPILYDNHVLQLATYGLLVEELQQAAPPYGLLRYADATLKIPFTAELRQQVLEAAAAIRRAASATQVKRSHDDAGRCQQCGYGHGCGEQMLNLKRNG
jgi:CRISPR-associated exonuclease Cas4